jgi:hypothetical protein
MAFEVKALVFGLGFGCDGLSGNQKREDPHPCPLPSDGRGCIIDSGFGDRALVRGSWSPCTLEGETGLSGTFPQIQGDRR